MSQVFIPSRGTNEADFSTGDFTVGRNLIVNGHSTINGNETVDGNLTVLGTINGGGGGGTVVTTTTLDNNTLPASLTSLTVSGASSLAAPLTITQTGTASSSIIQALEPSLASGNKATIIVGSDNTTNCAALSFTATDAFFSAPVATIGLLGHSGLRIDGANDMVTGGTITSNGKSMNATNGGYFGGIGFGTPGFIAAQLGTTAGGIPFVQGLDATGAAISLDVNPLGGTVIFPSNTITGSGGGTLTLPTGPGTIALNPASGTFVTTTTINNATLPASFTTLSASGVASFPTGAVNAGDLIFAEGSLPGTSTAFNSICLGGDVTNPSFAQAFNASGLPGTMLLNPGGGSVFTGSTLNVNGSVLTGGNSVALQLPVSSGTIALNPASGTNVTTVTINNATLPASFTTLAASGNVTISNNTIKNSSGNSITLPTLAGTLITSTGLNNNSLPASFTTLAASGTATVGGSNIVTATTLSNATLPASLTTLTTSGATTLNAGLSINIPGTSSTFTGGLDYLQASLANSGNIQFNVGVNASVANSAGQLQYMYTSSGSTSNAIRLKLVSGTNNLTIAGTGVVSTANVTIDDGSGNGSVNGTFKINGSTLTGGNTVALQLPSSAGVIALTSQLPPTNLGTAYFSFSVGSGGGNVTFVAQNSFGTSVITGTGTTTLNFPATTATTFYYVSYVSNATVSNTSTLGSMQNQVINDGKPGSLSFQVVPATTGTWQLNASTASAVTGYVTIVRTQ